MTAVFLHFLHLDTPRRDPRRSRKYKTFKYARNKEAQIVFESYYLSLPVDLVPAVEPLLFTITFVFFLRNAQRRDGGIREKSQDSHNYAKRSMLRWSEYVITR
jgi:hypothetical protein